MTTRNVVLPILGLAVGGHGALSIEQSLERVPGIERVYVNPYTEMAYVSYDPSAVRIDQLVSAVERVGFQAGQPILR